MYRPQGRRGATFRASLGQNRSSSSLVTGECPRSRVPVPFRQYLPEVHSSTNLYYQNQRGNEEIEMSKRLETVATMACMKTLLMLFNFILWASGMLILCIGIWMRIQLRDYIDMSVEGSGAALLALVSLGAILAVAATLACCCTARGHPALLYLYGAFLSVVAVLELGAGASIYAYRTSLNEGFDQGLNESMAVYGVDHWKSSHIDTMQSTLHCCGNRWYSDWLAMVPPKDVPKSCCKMEIPEEHCDTNQINNIYVEGCYNRVLEFINSNVGLVAGTAIGVAFFPLVGVFLACCLASNINKAKFLWSNVRYREDEKAFYDASIKSNFKSTSVS